MTDRRSAGLAAEGRAEAFLVDQGLRAVRRNFRCRGGEIDLVMRDAEHLVFVEVRLRNDPRFGGALASVDRRKRERIVLAARHYLATSGWTGPCRFDVVGFDGDRAPQWIRDAFSA